MVSIKSSRRVPTGPERSVSPCDFIACLALAMLMCGTHPVPSHGEGGVDRAVEGKVAT